MKVNVNDTVVVRLTPAGEAVFRNTVADNLAGDVLRCQLWELLAIFGPHMPMHPSMNTPVLFVDNELELELEVMSVEDAARVRVAAAIEALVDAEPETKSRDDARVELVEALEEAGL